VEAAGGARRHHSYSCGGNMLLSTHGNMLPAGDVHASMMLDDDVFNSPPSAATRRRWLAAARIAAGSSPPPPPVDLGSSWMRPRAGSSAAGLHASTSPPQMTLRDIRKVAPDKTHVPLIAASLRYYVVLKAPTCLQCFDAVGWAAGRASGR